MFLYNERCHEIHFFFNFREYLVELVGKPGYLCEPDSLLNGPSSISISSPLRFPRPRLAEPTIDFRSLAKQYFSDCQLLNLVFDEPTAGTVSESNYMKSWLASFTFSV